MLFIGDLHLHARYTKLILDSVREYIGSVEQEDHIVFLGDFVYHFSYHRVSLLALLDLFLELTQQNIHVYVLAGNHDRLGQHFVYSESAKILEQAPHSLLHIITRPEVVVIQDQNFLFLPYRLSRQDYEVDTQVTKNRPSTLLSLAESDNSAEQDSYRLNAYVEQQAQSYDNLTIIHHYYFASQFFPGIKSQFRFQDKALSPHFLSYDQLRFVSGHLHHAFSYENYLCVGSVWSTSPLESNMSHWLCQYNLTSHERKLTQNVVNPYLIMQTDEELTIPHIHHVWENIQQTSLSYFESKRFSLSFLLKELPLARTTLTLQTDKISYQDLDQHISPSLRQSLRDILLKPSVLNTDQAIKDLVDSSQDFGSSWSNRKQLLNNYLEQKYGDRKQEYLDLLEKIDQDIL